MMEVTVDSRITNSDCRSQMTNSDSKCRRVSVVVVVVIGGCGGNRWTVMSAVRMVIMVIV